MEIANLPAPSSQGEQTGPQWIKTLTDSEWVGELFHCIDAKDSERFLAFLVEDAQFRFGNAMPAIGREDIAGLLDGFFASIKSLRHELLDTWTTPGHVICRGAVTYMRHDGSTLCVPFVDVLAMRGSLIADYQIYIDASQLYAVRS